MNAAISEEGKATFAERNVPIGRYSEPEEVAQVVLSFVLPAAFYINGTVIVVDGGTTDQNR